MNASGNQRCFALPFVISLTSLSYGCVLILPFCISSLRFSPHDPILTKHQALAPSGPMLLLIKSRSVRVEFCFRASARAWQETHDLRDANEAHSTAKLRKPPCSSSHFWIQVSCRKAHSARATYCLVEKVASLFATFTWKFLNIVKMSGHTIQLLTLPNHTRTADRYTPNLSCLIPLLPYTNFTSWESHSCRHFSLYNIHFTGMTCLDPRLDIRKLQKLFT